MIIITHHHRVVLAHFGTLAPVLSRAQVVGQEQQLLIPQLDRHLEAVVVREGHSDKLGLKKETKKKNTEFGSKQDMRKEAGRKEHDADKK